MLGGDLVVLNGSWRLHETCRLLEESGKKSEQKPSRTDLYIFFLNDIIRSNYLTLQNKLFVVPCEVYLKSRQGLHSIQNSYGLFFWEQKKWQQLSVTSHKATISTGNKQRRFLLNSMSTFPSHWQRTI